MGLVEGRGEGREGIEGGRKWAHMGTDSAKDSKQTIKVCGPVAC